jgi:hypothetical protein
MTPSFPNTTRHVLDNVGIESVSKRSELLLVRGTERLEIHKELGFEPVDHRTETVAHAARVVRHAVGRWSISRLEQRIRRALVQLANMLVVCHEPVHEAGYRIEIA